MVRVGGFVIHGNNALTLGRCLDDLCLVCDEVLCVDSGSTDGSSALVEARGGRTIISPWRGYGAARAAAAAALTTCDYLFFLDSDETLAPGAAEAMRRWRASAPGLPHYTVKRRDWATLGEHRFVFRTETRARLVRRDCATWQADWIVHEALPRRPNAPLGAVVEHGFATAIDDVARKQGEYAFLWAVRAFAHGQRGSELAGRRLVAALRNGVVKGALWRGGCDGWRLSWAVGRYHAEKYRFLQALARGQHAEVVAAYRAGCYEAVLAAARLIATP